MTDTTGWTIGVYASPYVTDPRSRVFPAGMRRPAGHDDSPAGITLRVELRCDRCGYGSSYASDPQSSVSLARILGDAESHDARSHPGAL